MHLDHPIYSGTEEEFWIAIDSIEDDRLHDFVTRHESHYLERAMAVLGDFLKPEILTTLYIEPDHLIRPWHNETSGVSVYLTVRSDSPVPGDSDSWWIILACPQPFYDVIPAKNKFNVWSFGWFCQ